METNNSIPSNSNQTLFSDLVMDLQTSYFATDTDSNNGEAEKIPSSHFSDQTPSQPLPGLELEIGSRYSNKQSGGSIGDSNSSYTKSSSELPLVTRKKATKHAKKLPPRNNSTAPNIKFLISNENVGKFIGKSRNALNRLELSMKCRVVISRSEVFFPGTTDRTCLLYGNTYEDIMHDIRSLLTRFHQIGEGVFSESSTYEITAKIALPHYACGMIIGRGGAKIRSLSSLTLTRIVIMTSPTLQQNHERVAIISDFTPQSEIPQNSDATRATTTEGASVSSAWPNMTVPPQNEQEKNSFENNYDDIPDVDSSSLGLRKLVATKCCKHVDIGVAVMPALLFDEHAINGYAFVDSVPINSASTRYAQVVNREFNAVVIEHHLKWAPLCETLPGPMMMGETASNRIGRYDFHHCDLVIDWCLKRKIKVKGHVLVWHVTSPSFLADYTPEVLREQLRRHIYTVVGHFRGRIHCWDVVNEALAPDGTLANNIFYQKLGASYIDDSFRWAHDADPSAFLIYNDNKVEGCGLLPATRSVKADAFYNLLKGMKERGVPVHGAGMQAHFNAAGTGLSLPPTPRSVKAQIRRLGDLGLGVNLSEMDVRVGKLHPEDLQQLAQRQIYHDIIVAALTEPSFDGVWFWGVTDKHSWVSDFYAHEGNDEQLPLLFDKDYNKKDSAYGAVRDGLKTISLDGLVGGNVPLDSDCYPDGRPWGSDWISSPTELCGDADGNNTSRKDPDNSAAAAGDSRPDWLQN